MSSERQYPGMAKLFAIEEKQQREKAAEKAAEKISPPEYFAPPEQHTRVPNELFEDLLPTLKTSEQSVLLRLYRLSWGFQKDSCHVSMGKLAKSCNLSSRQV